MHSFLRPHVQFYAGPGGLLDWLADVLVAVNSIVSTLHPEPHPTPPPELHGAHGCHSPTSIIVFAVTTGSFHRCVTASSSPAQLTDAVPPIQVQGASAVAVAQPRAALCKAKHLESRSDHPRRTAVTHTHTPPANLQNAFTSISTSVPLAPREAGLIRNCHFTNRQLRLRGEGFAKAVLPGIGTVRRWYRQEVAGIGLKPTPSHLKPPLAKGIRILEPS